MKRLFIYAFVAALSLTACNTTPATQSESSCDSSKGSVNGDIAYVRSEYVLSESELFKTEGEALRAKSEKTQAAWAKSEQGFQYEANQLQEKYQKGLITSANAQKQQASIESRVKTYQTNAQKEAQAMEEENYVFTNRAQDLFRRAVSQLNENKDYKLILNASAIIDADTLLDLSDQVLTIINELYAAEQAETK